jgi:hypothetical protein
MICFSKKDELNTVVPNNQINLKNLLYISFLYFSGTTQALATYVNIGTIKYFGHDKEECERLNWENKIEQMNNLLLLWTNRNLTILPPTLSLQCLSFPIHKPSVLSLFIISPEKEPKISISFNANYISVLELKNNVGSSTN